MRQASVTLRKAKAVAHKGWTGSYACAPLVLPCTATLCLLSRSGLPPRCGNRRTSTRPTRGLLTAANYANAPPAVRLPLALRSLVRTVAPPEKEEAALTG